jgi:uncharacterized protein
MRKRRNMSAVTEIQQFHITALHKAVEEHFSADSSGHDWPHVRRVWRMANRLAQLEGADQYVTQLAALAHDLEDHKLDTTPRIRQWLEGIGVPAGTVDTVYDICMAVSFKGALVPDAMPSLEGRCVQDADRLDALGAIGIARTFAFGGSRGRTLYDPSDAGTLHSSFEAYKSKSTGSLNHFFEKLLLLKDRMHTPSALEIAIERHAYLEGFVQRFLSEWDGLD